MFFECFTQWRAGSGGVIGLDYPAVFQVAETLGIPLNRGILEKIRLMERWTLDAAAKVQKEKSKNAGRIGYHHKGRQIRRR